MIGKVNPKNINDGIVRYVKNLYNEYDNVEQFHEIINKPRVKIYGLVEKDEKESENMFEMYANDALQKAKDGDHATYVRDCDYVKLRKDNSSFYREVRGSIFIPNPDNFEGVWKWQMLSEATKNKFRNKLHGIRYEQFPIKIINYQGLPTYCLGCVCMNEKRLMEIDGG